MSVVGVMEMGISKMEASHTRRESTEEFVFLGSLRCCRSFTEMNVQWMQRMSIETMFSHDRRPIPVVITWSHGGRQVTLTRSWDNWELIEPMHRSGKGFILVKLLSSGWEPNEFAAESCEDLPESALPDSPEESYGRNTVHDADFSKPPPDLPPQMYRPLLDESPLPWTGVHQLIARPQHVVPNHLYMKSCDGQVVALDTTLS